jgi:1-acyl-sn-glycerol-3-phosphate acyltransferase
MSGLKTGIARLAQKYPTVPVQPVFLRGAGRALPKGGSYLVPFLCHAIVGEPLTWGGDKDAFMKTVADRLSALEHEAPPLHWD